MSAPELCQRCGSPSGASYTERGALLDAAHVVGGYACRAAEIARSGFVVVGGEELVDMQLAGVSIVKGPRPQRELDLSDKRTASYVPRWAHLLWLAAPWRASLVVRFTRDEELRQALCACADLAVAEDVNNGPAMFRALQEFVAGVSP